MAVSSVAHAGTPVIEGPVVTATHNDWQFTLGLYGWMPVLEGDVGVGGVVMPVDVSFSDILDNFNAGYMGMFEVRKGRWFGQLEGFYLKISDNLPFPVAGAPISGIQAVVQSSRIEAIFGYSVLDEGKTRLDIFGGVEWWGMDIEMTPFGAAPLVTLSARENWFDPMIGFRLQHEFSDRWDAILRAEVGGFGVNADIAWQAVGLVGYRLNPSAKIVAGWRYTEVDYTDGGFVFDAAMSGPVIAAVITW